MSWLRTPLGIAIAAALLPISRGHAQDPRLTARLDRETALAVSRIVDSARADSLPTDPLIARALEGASRRVAGPRIITVVRGYATALGNARSTLGSSA